MGKERSRKIDSNINDTGVKLLVTEEKQEKRGKQEEETELLHRATGFNNINAIDKNANKNSLVSINNSHTMNSTKNKEIANNMALICSSDFQNKSKDQYKAHSNNNYSSHPFIYPHKKRENFKTSPRTNTRRTVTIIIVLTLLSILTKKERILK